MAEVDKLCEILSLVEIENLNKNLAGNKDPRDIFMGVVSQVNDQRG
jgi:hypothetical protein